MRPPSVDWWHCSGCDVLLQKIQAELSSHEQSLEDMKKKNEERDPSDRVRAQIDITQVRGNAFSHR